MITTPPVGAYQQQIYFSHRFSIDSISRSTTTVGIYLRRHPLNIQQLFIHPNDAPARIGIYCPLFSGNYPEIIPRKTPEISLASDKCR